METVGPDERAASRATLLPEEQAAGSADPEAQAEAILADSDERTVEADGASDQGFEHRTSDEATEPPT